MVGDSAVEGRKAGHSAEPGGAPVVVDGDAVLVEGAVGQSGDSGGTVLAGLDRQGPAALMLEGEADVGPGHCEPFHDVEAGGIFGALGAQELAAGRDPGEQLLDPDAGTRREGGRPLPFEPAVVDDSGPAVGASNPAFDGKSGDAGDGGERLAPEAQSGHRLDLLAGQLRGGVAFEREGHVGGAHSAAVVGDLDPVGAAAAERDGDPGGARVDRVFDELLQRAGRSFHHFTRGDAVDQMLGQAAY
jgi:hypothetical protein